ncbi:hypothetical protein NW762_001506 [Fusarium torreyae]|uniref:Uncharacterized protein n=1 Tax=Fusarium torreyae TaxID=1237075 RepID=A0A9W8SFT1_9HYPO|nr:hypothetical protein NW762_001506 [Fusarium torreyae]
MGSHEAIGVDISSSNQQYRPSSDSGTTLPAPDVESLFTPEYARLAFNLLGLNDGIPRFKLDPTIFSQYPELFDHGADIIATGTKLSPDFHAAIPSPTQPGPVTNHIYNHLTALCLKAFSDIQTIDMLEMNFNLFGDLES